MTIIGVVGDRRSQLDEDVQPMLYTFYLQAGRPGAGEMSMDLLVRTAGDPMTMVAMVRGQIASADHTQTPTRIMTLERRLAQYIAPRRVNLLLLAAFSALALILGAVGIYGVVSHSVSRRTHEIGVRMALGAGKMDIVRQIVGRGLLPVVIGEAAGLGAALALNRVIASMLFHVTTTDAGTYSAVAVIWSVVGAAACYIPARRAMKLDPLGALRCE
jgi:putative ABC transport system permease protein